MCGIAGILSTNPQHIQTHVLHAMCESLAHRGPDGSGIWIGPGRNIGFGHRRLAVIDLSDDAAQPMHYLQRYSIVYNGEIYNYLELRKELKKAGYHFYNNSDTEVILAAYDCYREKCVQYFDGMFAFAIWDEHEQSLFAARDRFGEKPFFYHTNKQQFVFGSEMKALWAAGIHKTVEQKMLLNYLTLGYVQNPANKAQTFYKDIFSVPPSHYLIYRRKQLRITAYFNIDKQALIKISDEDAMKKMDLLFSGSITQRLRSDVPVGCSLSGGLDSSSILYYMMQQSGSDSGMKTFSAFFPGFEKDESAHVQKVTKALRVPNFPVVPDVSNMIDSFVKLLYHQEEPFPSSSIYTQYKVYETAALHGVKVLLDGQGADEILAGYHRYLHWYLQEMVSRYKFSGAKHERQLMRQHKAGFSWNVKNLVAAFLPSHASIALEKKEFKKIIHHPDISKHMRSFVKGREWEGIHKPVVTKLNDMLYFNTMQNGLEELLRFSDRNSMAHGVEVRLPYLQADLVQFIFSLPSSFKIREGYNKYIWRKLMDKRLPDSVVWRTDKVGFEPPQQEWMEDSRMVDYLFEARKKLVGLDILRPQILQKKHKPVHAYDARNYDWRYLCAAALHEK
jgi:asparagine synthase (glutamine-hydrolysing)